MRFVITRRQSGRGKESIAKLHRRLPSARNYNLWFWNQKTRKWVGHHHYCVLGGIILDFGGCGQQINLHYLQERGIGGQGRVLCPSCCLLPQHSAYAAVVAESCVLHRDTPPRAEDKCHHHNSKQKLFVHVLNDLRDLSQKRSQSVAD